MMELRELEALVAVAEERHFTRAARRLHLTQPALSQQVRRLEDRLGVRLVERTPHHVALTDAGERLVTRARRITAEVAAARAEVDAIKGLRSGRVVIGVGRASGSYPLAERLAAFREQAPGVEVVLWEDLSAPITVSLLADEIDLALITPIAPDEYQGLTVQSVARERLVAVLPPGHRMARRRRIGLADLDGDPFIAFPPGAVIRRRLEGATGAPLTPAFEVGQLGRMTSLVAAGLGVAVLPASDAAAARPAVASVPLDDPALVQEVLLAHRTGRDLGPPAEALRRVLEAPAGAIPDLGPGTTKGAS